MTIYYYFNPLMAYGKTLKNTTQNTNKILHININPNIQTT